MIYEVQNRSSVRVNIDVWFSRFDRDMRAEGGADLDLRGKPGMLSQLPPSQLMSGQFDPDFRQQNSGIAPLLPRPNQGPSIHGGMRGGHPESLRELYDETEGMGSGDRGPGLTEGPSRRGFVMGGLQFGDHPPRSLLEQEGWGSGPRKRRWGERLLDEEDNHGDLPSGPGGNFRQGGSFHGEDNFRGGYPVSPGEAGDSPSNGQNFGNDLEDSPGGSYGRENRGPAGWGGGRGPYRPTRQGSPFRHQLEGGFRSRGGRGGFSGRGRGGASRGGSRGRYGGHRGMRGGRGPKRGQF